MSGAFQRACRSSPASKSKRQRLRRLFVDALHSWRREGDTTLTLFVERHERHRGKQGWTQSTRHAGAPVRRSHVRWSGSCKLAREGQAQARKPQSRKAAKANPEADGPTGDTGDGDGLKVSKRLSFSLSPVRSFARLLALSQCALLLALPHQPCVRIHSHSHTPTRRAPSPNLATHDGSQWRMSLYSFPSRPLLPRRPSCATVERQTSIQCHSGE